MSEQLTPKEEIQREQDKEWIKKYLRIVGGKSIHELASENNISPEDIPLLFNKKVAEVINFSKKKEGVLDVTFLEEEIGFLFNCFQEQSHITADSALFDWAKTIRSYDQFIKHYMPNRTNRIKADVMKRIDYFIRFRVHPHEYIEVVDDTRRYRAHTAYPQQDWYVIYSDKYQKDIISKGVLEEVIELDTYLKNGANLYHASGSAALEGIGKAGAILSAEEAAARAHKIKTGEFVTYMALNNKPATGGESGLGNVFASNDKGTAYSIARWFDEYHVTFGFNAAQLQRYREQTQTGHTEIWGNSDGIRCGLEIS